MCFESEENDSKIYIAPQLLPKEKPRTFQWETNKNTLQYVYEYPFMPKGIIGRLIVKVNEEIEKRNGMRTVWEKGAILYKEKEVCRVLILEDKNPDSGLQHIRIEVIV